MTEKVRYERRIFTHFLTEEGQSIFYLLDPLEKLIVNLGGYPGITRCYNTGDERDVITGEQRDYMVGKSNGAHSLVTLEARLEKFRSSNFIKAFVVNVENYEHRDLLAALHAFYDGKQGYNGMPSPAVEECEVHSQ